MNVAVETAVHAVAVFVLAVAIRGVHQLSDQLERGDTGEIRLHVGEYPGDEGGRERSALQLIAYPNRGGKTEVPAESRRIPVFGKPSAGIGVRRQTLLVLAEGRHRDVLSAQVFKVGMGRGHPGCGGRHRRGRWETHRRGRRARPKEALRFPPGGCLSAQTRSVRSASGVSRCTYSAQVSGDCS